MDDLEIYCDADANDKLVVNSDQAGLYIETIMPYAGDGTPCIRLNVETAQQLAEALIKWVNQQ